MPSPLAIPYENPVTLEARPYAMPDGCTGSLVALFSPRPAVYGSRSCEPSGWRLDGDKRGLIAVQIEAVEDALTRQNYQRYHMGQWVWLGSFRVRKIDRDIATMTDIIEGRYNRWNALKRRTRLVWEDFYRRCRATRRIWSRGRDA